MSGTFGLLDSPNPHRVERLIDFVPRADVFALRREGLLVPGASGTLMARGQGCRIDTRGPGKVFIDGTGIVLRLHALGMPVFICSSCGRDRYQLYRAGELWACRTCHRLDYASRHRNRTVKGYARLLWLRRRLGVEVRPFAPLPAFPRRAHRKRELVAEIRALESRLLGHLRHDVNDVVERRHGNGR